MAPVGWLICGPGQYNPSPLHSDLKDIAAMVMLVSSRSVTQGEQVEVYEWEVGLGVG